MLPFQCSGPEFLPIHPNTELQSLLMFKTKLLRKDLDNEKIIYPPARQEDIVFNKLT